LQIINATEPWHAQQLPDAVARLATDARLAEAAALRTTEAPLTGES